MQPQWSTFGNWSECSASCKPGGQQFRVRECLPSGNECPLGLRNQYAQTENVSQACNLVTSCAGM